MTTKLKEVELMSPEALKTEPSRFVWYELHTPDAAPAEAFYKGVLGWGMQDAGMPNRPYTLVTVAGIPIGGLLQKPASGFTSGEKAGWMGYIGVEDLDAILQRLENAHGFVHRAPEEIPGVGRFAVVADPQGAIFVLFQPPKGMQQPERPSPGTPGTAAWHDLAAVEWQSDFNFYADLFGWSKSQAMDMGTSGVYQIFAVGSEPIGGMMNRMNPSQSPGWLFYFNVDDIDSAVARVKQHGGTVIHGPSVVPGGQQIAHCLDTQGAIFGIVGPPKQ
ncbi:MAG TPA: VOC family protein [Bryobacteraceae bacterium]|nr:VOC family protein [Bryobacteraceae bacterium]